MPGMVRSALCLVLAVLMLAGYIPLPARGAAIGPVGAAMGPSGAASCCAIKACCRAGAGHVCAASGAACEGPTGVAASSRAPAPKNASAPWLLAGGCGTQTPLVTPVNLDPTLAPPAMSLGAVIAVRMPVRGTDDLTFLGHIPDPQVPPPRA
jgi:hypothetical protein